MRSFIGTHPDTVRHWLRIARPLFLSACQTCCFKLTKRRSLASKNMYMLRLTGEQLSFDPEATKSGRRAKVLLGVWKRPLRDAWLQLARQLSYCHHTRHHDRVVVASLHEYFGVCVCACVHVGLRTGTRARARARARASERETSSVATAGSFQVEIK